MNGFTIAHGAYKSRKTGRLVHVRSKYPTGTVTFSRDVNGTLEETKTVKLASFRRTYRRAIRSVSEMERMNTLADQYFFSPDTLKFFSGRIHDEVYDGPKGVFFVHSVRCTWNDKYEKFGGSWVRVSGHEREYKVEQFDPDTGRIITEDRTANNYASRNAAHNAARRLAGL